MNLGFGASNLNFQPPTNYAPQLLPPNNQQQIIFNQQNHFNLGRKQEETPEVSQVD
jgi:hypothetical protein